MDTLSLESLHIEHFKGITSFDLVAAGQDISILGDNELGKTTISDACSWLFTGKDSKGRADFALKPLDAGNNEIHHLETVVKGTFSFNGKPITLKKMFKENYVQKKGSATKEFSGHVKEHWIDDIPKKEGEFKTAIKDMFDEETYLLVSDPMYFANIPWPRRREILLDMSGDISDLEVIESDAELSPLADLVKEKSIDDIRTMAKSQMRQINKDIQGIPPRISELENQMADTYKPDDKELSRLEKQLQYAKDKLSSLQTNEAMSNHKEQLSNVSAQIAQIKADAAKASMANQKPVMDKIKTLNKESSQLSQQITTLEESIKRDQKRNQLAEEAMVQLRVDWDAANSAKVYPDKKCPTCGQDLPADQVQAVIDKFNQAKAEKLKSISDEGKTLKANVEQRNNDIEVAQAKLSDVSIRMDEISAEIAELEKSLDDTGTTVENKELRDLEHEKAKHEGMIKALKNGTAVQEKDTREKIEEAQKEIDTWRKAQAEYEAAGKARTRINELLAQEKTLSAEYERLEHQMFLTDRFVVRKVELLEDQINSKFSTAKFKMFKQLVNGGIDDKCCEVLYKGVPFNSGLNTAAQVNVGLDICNVLSEHFGLQAPVWIDNRESVNNLLPVEAQVISMSVTKDKELIVSSGVAEMAQAS